MYGANEAKDLFGGCIFENAEERKIFETVPEVGAIEDFATKQKRSQAMACALAWIDNGDYSFDALAESVATIADLDGDDEFSDDEEEYYNDLMVEVGYAFTALGADSSNVEAYIGEESDADGATLGAFLSEKMKGVEDDDETLISNYAVSNDLVMEGLISFIKHGIKAWKRKRIGRAHRMTSAQKMGLKKARKKAWIGAAIKSRWKSMKKALKLHKR
ncbi:MAG: hypothetical protein ACOYOS_18375 [Syntrophales bacterium]